VEWLDIGNMIGDVALVGGMRRSSQITFSDLDDEAMRHAKDFPFPKHRAMSNNSAVYSGRPDLISFMREWTALAASGSGERGIFNLAAAMKAGERREASEHLRTNPCGEILLRADLGQFCNLSEVVVRSHDDLGDLQEKTRLAVWLGAMQASLTNFPFIRRSFREISERERLLGVSLTGQLDHPSILSAENLQALKRTAIQECREACAALGIPMSASVTTGKPSGTVSQLVNCASGAHPRYARHYLRRYRVGADDPIFHLMRAEGVPFVPEVGQRPEDVETRRAELVARGHAPQEAARFIKPWAEAEVTTWVVEFPEAAPEGAVTRDEVSAIDQLEWYLKLRQNWCEHNQSMTVYVRDDEWLRVGDWVYRNFDQLIGVSFLPYDGGRYELAPYQEITAEEYRRRVAARPAIDFSRIGKYEREGIGADSYACAGDSCELK
jgi:ribonucleoside-diphosphate reductase alpha chain